jgi:hypothetical protein
MTGFDRLLFRRVSSTLDAALLAFLSAGILFWATGAAVKLILMYLGRPTIPWREFLYLDSLGAELFIAVLIMIPHFVFIMSSVKDRHGEMLSDQKETGTIWALRGGCLAIILSGIAVFWTYDPFVLLLAIPFISLFTAVCMLAAGYAANCVSR